MRNGTILFGPCLAELSRRKWLIGLQTCPLVWKIFVAMDPYQDVWHGYSRRSAAWLGYPWLLRHPEPVNVSSPTI